MKNKAKLKKLPQKPGVYIFLNNKKKVIYIGKAINLRNRVRSYFNKSSELTPAKKLMVQQIADIDYTVVDTEAEALLLETNLIKKYKPPYNVMLKDDKYWQYIKIDYSGDWAQIYATRRPSFVRLKRTTAGKPDFRKKEKAKYPRTKAELGAGFRARALHFGPYTSGVSVKEVLRQIKKLFPVCLNLPKNQSKNIGCRPCFNYHLGRCLGPCVGEISPAEYAKTFDNIADFLRGEHRQLVKKLESKMRALSEEKKYETAAKTRDTYMALKKLDQRQKVVTNSDENIDLISLYRVESQVAINVFKVRHGKLIGKFNSLTKDSQNDDVEIITSFIDQYYVATTERPKEVYVLEKLGITTSNGIKVKQSIRGRKAQLLQLGRHNAYEYLKQQENFFTKQNINTKQSLEELKKTLKLKTIPNRIETYDIANVQGVSAVGGMAVFVNGTADKKEYRKFSIKHLFSPDDPGMMAEILGRRINNRAWGKPDLIVLDGGKGQLNVVNEVMKSLSYKVPLIALAKQEEDIYVLGKKTPIKLSKRSPALQLLQQMRDEVHRYSNSFYQKKHGRAMTKSSLDEIPGIGPKTKKLLKTKYGSVANINKISLDELTKLIGPGKAKIIKDKL